MKIAYKRASYVNRILKNEYGIMILYYLTLCLGINSKENKHTVLLFSYSQFWCNAM